MSSKNISSSKNNPQELSKPKPTQEPPFVERNIDDADNISVDENGFSRTPNGSFWDSQGDYFNHQGFDKHGGFYDKYGVYIPGPGYDESKGMYKDDEGLVINEEGDEAIKNSSAIKELKDQEDNDRHVVKDINGLEENPSPEDEDYVDENKNNHSFDDEEIKSIFNETKNDQIQVEKKGVLLGEEQNENKENIGINANIANVNGGTSLKSKGNNEKNYFSATVISGNKEEHEMKTG